MHTFLRFVSVTLLVFLAACADKAVAPYPVSEPAQKTDAAFGAGDIFDVRVFDEEELSATYQVSPDGAIAFPLIGRVEVQGKLPSQLEAEIQSRLADGYLKNPQVSVLPKESRSKKVSVLGQVKQPGVFLYADSMSIVEAISKAGGFTSTARKNAVRVTRDTAEAKVATFIVAVEDIGRGKAPNFFLRPGDVIYVPERPF